uniref:Uncharacterized protein n=1 Tax=Setaria digitata TaxID=48799 RepID=A0A915PMC0_9BILA
MRMQWRLIDCYAARGLARDTEMHSYAPPKRLLVCVNVDNGASEAESKAVHLSSIMAQMSDVLAWLAINYGNAK